MTGAGWRGTVLRMVRSRRSRTVLLTAFEPFGDRAGNASAMAVAAVQPSHLPRGVQLVRAELPCVFGAAIVRLRALLRQHRPDLVVCTGQAAGNTRLAIERVAINVDDAAIADNAGAQPVDRRVVARGPVAYWSSLPIKAIAAALRQAAIPAAISQSAGTFVCNHTFYGLMHALRRRPRCRGGFVHLPLATEQLGPNERDLPSLPVAVLARGLVIAIAVALTTKHDGRHHGGALHGALPST